MRILLSRKRFSDLILFCSALARKYLIDFSLEESERVAHRAELYTNSVTTLFRPFLLSHAKGHCNGYGETEIVRLRAEDAQPVLNRPLFLHRNSDRLLRERLRRQLVGVSVNAYIHTEFRHRNLNSRQLESGFFITRSFPIETPFQASRAGSRHHQGGDGIVRLFCRSGRGIFDSHG